MFRPRLYLIGALIFALAPHTLAQSTPSPPPLEPAASETDEAKVYVLSDAVRHGHLHSDGSMWFATNDEGVYRYDGRSFVHYTKQQGLSSNHVNVITHDDEGNLWFGTDRGLCRFDGEAFTHVPIPWDGNEDLWGPGMNANEVLSLLCDRRGEIWLGTWGNGVHRFDPSREVGPGRYEFTSFLQDQGVIYEDGDHRNAIQSMTEDRNGDIWLTSMSQGGVSRFDGTAFENWSREDGMSDDMVFSVCEDRTGSLWFGMLGNRNGGLDRFDGETFAHFNEASGLCSNNIICIFEDRAGTLWLGSERGELCQLTPSADPDEPPVIAPFTIDGRRFEKIRFITEDSSGGVWFGGNYGQLYRYDGRELVDHSRKE
jgi:ligand-binding sensor domain-containing protein